MPAALTSAGGPSQREQAREPSDRDPGLDMGRRTDRDPGLDTSRDTGRDAGRETGRRAGPDSGEEGRRDGPARLPKRRGSIDRESERAEGSRRKRLELAPVRVVEDRQPCMRDAHQRKALLDRPERRVARQLS